MGDVAKAWVEEQGCWPPTLAGDLPNPMDSGTCVWGTRMAGISSWVRLQYTPCPPATTPCPDLVTQFGRGRGSQKELFLLDTARGDEQAAYSTLTPDEQARASLADLEWDLKRTGFKEGPM